MRRKHVSNEMVDHIRENMKLAIGDCLNDRPHWIPSTNGVFSTKIAYDIVRRRAGKLGWVKHI